MLVSPPIRRLFSQIKNNVYLHTASNGLLSDPAYRNQDRAYQIARAGRTGAQEEVFAALERIRVRATKIFDCRRSETGFGFNTTFGLNLAVFGLPLEAGDEVLLNDVEFPANVYPWLELRRRGIKVNFLKSNDGFFDIDHFRQAISPRTKVLSLSYVQYFNGYKVDLKAIGEICRRHNIWLVVDAIQAAGCETMKMKKWGVAIASAGAQKWLLASQGTGIYFVSEEIQDLLTPPWRSWLAVDWKCNWAALNDYTKPFEEGARQYEMGTYPGALMHGLDWSLAFLTDIGVANIQRHNHELIDILIDYLKTEPRYRITSCLVPRHRSSIFCFATTRGSVVPLHRFLMKNRIITSLRQGAIRVSVHLYNNTGDISRLIRALKEYGRRL